MTGWRTGIDLAATDDVRESITRHGARYLDRVYTPAEQDACRRQDGAADPARLAGRFAAKEACLKLLHPADHDALPWTSVEIVDEPAGGVGVRFHGPAAELAARIGLGTVALSLARERGSAVAIAVASSG